MYDDLDVMLRRRQAAERSQNNQAPRASINPPLNGSIGNQRIILPGQREGVVQFVTADENTLPITIAFTQRPPAGNRPTFMTERQFPRGYVQFGSKGAHYDLKVDICQGTMFTVPASSVYLQVGMDAIPGLPNPGPELALPLVGGISFHPVIRTQPVTWTEYVDKAGGGAADFDVQVPPFAKSVVFYANNFNGGGGAYNLVFRNQTVATTSYAFFAAAGANALGEIEIAGDITRITVTSALALTGRMIFNLDL